MHRTPRKPLRTGADAEESRVKELDGKLGVEPVEAGP
jgi:hypothetical protein